MKTTMLSAITAILCLTGCVTTPSTDIQTIKSQATFLGQTAAIIAMSSDEFNPEIQKTTVVVLKTIKGVTISTNETVAQTWAPVYTKEINKLVEDGSLKPEYKPIAMVAMSSIALGVDYAFSKHPEWKTNAATYSEVVNAFIGGALTVLDTECDDCTVSGSLNSDLIEMKTYINQNK